MLQAADMLTAITSRCLQLSQTPVGAAAIAIQPTRQYWGNQNKPVPRHKHRPNKHWPEEFAKYRAAKVLKIDLPDYDMMRKLMSEEVRVKTDFFMDVN